VIKEDEDLENDEVSSFSEKKDAATASSYAEKQKGFAGKVSVVKLKKVVI